MRIYPKPIMLDEKAPQVCLDLVDAFKAAGINKPVPFGGVIRDHFLGIPHRDIDIQIGASDIETLMKKVQTVEGIVNVELKSTSAYAEVIEERYTARFDGHTLDLVVVNFESDAHILVRTRDEPLCAVAVNPDDNRLIAHPDFMYSVKNRIYTRCDRQHLAIERFKHLQSKIPNLKFGV